MMKRELWLDYSRVFACVLVTLGHLIMSFQDAMIILENKITPFVIDYIYHFHVYIFFFCGGYLFQKKFSKYNRSDYFKNKLFRCIDYCMIYFVFSTITYLIKVLFSTDVNTSVNYTFLQTIFQHPINQMWYMYAILVITFISPVLKSTRSCITALVVAITAKILMCIPYTADHIPHPIDYLFNNEIWFILGSIWAYNGIVLRKKYMIGCILFFSIISILVHLLDLEVLFLNAFLTLTGMIGFTELIRSCSGRIHSIGKIGHVFSKYMLQIYLMHTIFAAGIRIVLLRLNIDNLMAHLVLGLIFSFGAPIFCAYLAERIKPLNIFFFPSKTIFMLRKNDKKGLSH